MWPVIAAVAGSVLSGALQSSSAKKAAQTQADSSERAAAIQAQAAREALAQQQAQWQDQLAMYRGSLAMQQPGYGIGTNALAQLSSLYGLYDPASFENRPLESTVTTTRSGPPPGSQSAAPQSYAGPEGQLYATPQQAYDSVWNDLKAEGIATASPIGQALLAKARTQSFGAPSGQSGFMSDQGGNALSGDGYGTTTTTTTTDPGYQLQIPDYTPTGMAGFYGGPEYQLNQQALQNALERGTLGLDRAAAASGGVLSGAQGKRLTDYALGQNTNYLTTAYGDYANRLSQLAGIGQTAAGSGSNLNQNLSSALSNMGQNQADLTMTAGNAGALGQYNAGQAMGLGQTASGAAWGNALGNIGNFVSQNWGQLSQGWGQPATTTPTISPTAGANAALGAGTGWQSSLSSPFAQGYY